MTPTLTRFDLTDAKRHLEDAERYLAEEAERLATPGSYRHITTYPTLALAAATAGMLAYQIAAAEADLPAPEPAILSGGPYDARRLTVEVREGGRPTTGLIIDGSVYRRSEQKLGGTWVYQHDPR